METCTRTIGVLRLDRAPAQPALAGCLVAPARCAKVPSLPKTENKRSYGAIEEDGAPDAIARSAMRDSKAFRHRWSGDALFIVTRFAVVAQLQWPLTLQMALWLRAWYMVKIFTIGALEGRIDTVDRLRWTQDGHQAVTLPRGGPHTV